jgi:SAM-dependent MidA family methyltransferase
MRSPIPPTLLHNHFSVMNETASSALHEILLQQYLQQGELRFHQFMRTALFEPQHGYYARADRARVGKTSAHDFSTATQLGELWGILLKESLTHLLQPAAPSQYTLVEIGVEPEGSPLLRIDPSPFAGSESRALGDSRPLPDKAVIFFNEVLDAQPFHRVRYTPAGWMEAAVRPDGTQWQWEWLPPEPHLISHLQTIQEPLAGQILDLPLAACDWLRQLLQSNWQGILLTIDYGKTWNELVHEFPEGTGRAFFQQKVHGDLLARPGDQDLTCDPCWNWLEDVLHQHGCQRVERQRLEAFWLQHSRQALENVFLTGNMQDRSVLRELLHPSFYGMRFEALSATKP